MTAAIDWHQLADLVRDRSPPTTRSSQRDSVLPVETLSKSQDQSGRIKHVKQQVDVQPAASPTSTPCQNTQ